MRVPISPCKECKHHQPGCHSACEGYKGFKDEKERINEIIRTERRRRELPIKRRYRA